jgi:hypothetical protein
MALDIHYTKRALVWMIQNDQTLSFAANGNTFEVPLHPTYLDIFRKINTGNSFSCAELERSRSINGKVTLHSIKKLISVPFSAGAIIPVK